MSIRNRAIGSCPCPTPARNISAPSATTIPAAAGSRWPCSGATLTPPELCRMNRPCASPPFRPMCRSRNCSAMVKSALREHVPLVEAMQQLRAQGHKGLPAPEQIRSEWTPAQEKALAEIVSMDQVRRIWVGSLEITELVRRQLQQQISSIGASQFGLPVRPGRCVKSSVSSPFGGVPRQRGFWFNVNAELIIYGATEPDATVTIGDRQNQTAPRRHFQFPLRAAGRRISPARGRPFRRRRGNARGPSRIQPEHGLHRATLARIRRTNGCNRRWSAPWRDLWQACGRVAFYRRCECLHQSRAGCHSA